MLPLSHPPRQHPPDGTDEDHRAADMDRCAATASVVATRPVVNPSAPPAAPSSLAALANPSSPAMLHIRHVALPTDSADSKIELVSGQELVPVTNPIQFSPKLQALSAPRLQTEPTTQVSSCMPARTAAVEATPWGGGHRLTGIGGQERLGAKGGEVQRVEGNTDRTTNVHLGDTAETLRSWLLGAPHDSFVTPPRPQGKGEDAGRVSSARNPRTPERGADDWSKHMQTPANHRSSSASTDPIDGLSGLESVRSQPKSVANVEEPVGRAGIGILFERYSFAHGCRSKTVVKSIQPLSSADREGTVRPGDQLLYVNGDDIRGLDLEKVKRMLTGRNGSTCELCVKQAADGGEERLVNVTLVRGCLEWWELHDRVALAEQQLAEASSEAQELRNLWMVESKHAASEASRAQKLELELESSQTLLENTRIALDRTQEHSKVQADAAATVHAQVQAELSEARKETRTLQAAADHLQQRLESIAEERDLSHRMYREVDTARKATMQRLADAQASLELLNDDKLEMQNKTQSLQHELERLRTHLSEREEANMDAQANVEELKRQLSDCHVLTTRHEGEILRQTRQSEALRLRLEVTENESAALQRERDQLHGKVKELEAADLENTALVARSGDLQRRLTGALESLAVSEAKNAHSAGMETAMGIRLRKTEEKMAADQSLAQQLVEDHERLLRKYDQLEAAHQGCAAVKRTATELEQRVEEQRATLREQEEAVRSRDVQIARLEESRQISSNVLEAQRATFEERMNAAQKQLAEKMLASQVAFDAEVAKFTDSQQTLQQAHHSLKVQMDEERLASQFALAQQKLEYEAKLKEKDVQLAEREAESEALMRDSDARVGKARGALQQALQTQIAALEQQMQTLKDEKAAASLAHESLVDKLRRDFQAEKEQLLVEHERRMQGVEEEKTRLKKEIERKASFYEELLRRSQDDYDKLVASVPEQVQGEAAMLNEEISRLRKEAEALTARVTEREKQKAEANFEVERAKLLNEIALEKAKNETTEHRLQAAFDAQHARLLKEHAIELHATRAELDKASNEGTRLGADLQRLRLDLENEKRTTAITMEHSNQVRLDDHALRAEVQRLKDELTTMHAQSETEKRAIISEWQATRDNMAANHLQDVMKLSNEARDKQLALGREHEEILARTDHQHRMQMQDKEREFTEKMAEAAKQLKDELTRDKMQWMAQNAATESDLITIAEIARARGVELLGQVLSYKQERDFLRLELTRLKCGSWGAEHAIEPEDREMDDRESWLPAEAQDRCTQDTLESHHRDVVSSQADDTRPLDHTQNASWNEPPSELHPETLRMAAMQLERWKLGQDHKSAASTCVNGQQGTAAQEEQVQQQAVDRSQGSGIEIARVQGHAADDLVLGEEL